METKLFNQDGPCARNLRTSYQGGCCCYGDMHLALFYYTSRLLLIARNWLWWWPLDPRGFCLAFFRACAHSFSLGKGWRAFTDVSAPAIMWTWGFDWLILSVLSLQRFNVRCDLARMSLITDPIWVVIGSLYSINWCSLLWHRQLFEIVIQASVRGKITSRET